ncbi:MAG: hypothetical protein Q9163_004370 [Psora crenata]
MRLLLGRQYRSLSEDDWTAFLNLQSHVDDFRTQQAKNEEGLTAWQTIELMSQAALTYSGGKESMTNVQAMLARVMINTHTLTTPTLDPLGLCLAPPTAMLNHSCTPNAHIIFDGQTLTLRSLASVPANTELTIAYIDTTNPTAIRRSELQSRYFFTCACPACSAGSTHNRPDPPSDPHFMALSTRALQLQAEAAVSSAWEAAPKFKAALELLASYPPSRQPYSSILHDAFLNAIACRSWPLALQRALKAYFDIDPVHYPLSWHPLRLVRKWVLLRSVAHVARLASEGAESVKVLERFAVEWRMVAEGLWKEVSDGVEMSHGKQNSFAEEIRLFGNGIGMGGPGLGKEEMEREWVKLRKIIGYRIE